MTAISPRGQQTMPSCGDRPHLYTDLETFSSEDLSRAGVFRYAESPDFEILLLAYAWDHHPVEVLDLTAGHDADEMLQSVIAGLLDPAVIKVAHNCSFERACLSRYLGCDLPPEEWEDTMVLCAMHGLPLSLDAAGAALLLSEQKLREGAALISYFCKPCRPTAANGGRTRNLSQHAPDKWARFAGYCRRDVEVERTIHDRLRGLPVPAFERRVQALDARINERGVLADLGLASAAVEIDERVRAANLAELQRLTGLDNPNSVAQLKTCLRRLGIETDSLDKGTVEELLQQSTDPLVCRVLRLRQQLGKTSTRKYQAILDAASGDHRLRGLLQYYGAGRTGRWAGRRVQLQNLSRNYLAQIAEVRELVRRRDVETLTLCFDSVSDVLSQLIRTAFMARPGYTLLVADYSAIEARVTAYLAGEQWRLDAFSQGEDIYCRSAARMFGVPVEKHGINAHLRQKGKIAELACGFGGGVAALKAFGADRMGLSDSELQEIVHGWRLASPAIPALWRSVEHAAKEALRRPGITIPVPGARLAYRRDADALRCSLPSGRLLSYWGASLDKEGAIMFMGQNQTTRHWERMTTWGGRLVENVVQAFARDCLAVALLRLAQAGYEIVFHVHDEVIVDAPAGSHWQDIAAIMAQPIPWAPGLPLAADGYETLFYRKD